MAHPGRNDRCPCGSGKKYKHCCELKTHGNSRWVWIALVVGGAILAAIIAGNSDRGDGGGRVWSAEHGHYHDASGREVPR